MKTENLFLGLAIMASVTYLCRFPFLVLFRKPIKNRFIQSFLYYLPYSVLSIMVFPAIFFSTASLLSGFIGTAVALLLGFFKKGLFTVALSSVFAVLIVELLKILFIRQFGFSF